MGTSRINIQIRKPWSPKRRSTERKRRAWTENIEKQTRSFSSDDSVANMITLAEGQLLD